MSDTKNVFFRSSVRGYNKSDVNEYLVRQSKEVIEREEAASERVRRAESESAKLQEKIESLESEISELRFQLMEKDERIDILNAEKAEFESKVDELSADCSDECKEKLEQQENVIAKQFEEIDRLRSDLESMNLKLAEVSADRDKFDELSKKAALYEKTSSNIGEAIISANKTAEEIISAAREEARLLTDKAQKELEEKRKNLEESSKRTIESIFGKLMLAASEGKKDIAATSNSAYQTISKAVDEVKARSSATEARLKNYEESLWRSIRDDLDSIGNVQSPKLQKKNSPEHNRRFKK